jgi:hypothetical protein
MKFVLEPYNRNVPNDELLADLKRVASKLNQDSLSRDEYDRNGLYSASTMGKRFGSWAKALESAHLQVRKYQIITRDELIDDLKRVATLLNKDKITHAEYDSYGKYSSNAFISKYKNWFAALEAAGLKKTRNFNISNEDYFKNLEEVWVKLGRQPKSNEMEKPLSNYTSGAYENRFGTWRKSLIAFVDYINNYQEPEEPTSLVDSEIIQNNETTTIDSKPHKTKRNISWRLRFIIMKRDNFKCQKCGRSPSTNPLVQLQVDHIKPWVKGGETIPENLETLCMECNIGKGDLY